MRMGLGAAMVIFFGGILLWAWRQDKKAKASRAGLERI
jgi:cbb3-type cytochrome oxidase subunit 3